MRALVISGGGSKGAFAGGIAEYLVCDCGQRYQILIGTSTGSLMIPLIALGRIDQLKEAYTTVTQSDIFKVSPFLISKKGGVVRTGIHHFNVLRMFLRGAKTFGDSTNLRDLIYKFMSKADYELLRLSGKEVITTVSNLSTNDIEYKSCLDFSYEDFCDWLWISANAVPFMSLVKKEGFEYADGGFGDHVALKEAIDRGATEVDVIVLRTEHKNSAKLYSRNAFDLLLSIFDFMLYQISHDDITIGQLSGLKRNVKINLYYTPRMLTENSLYFNPEKMKNWWNEGFVYAKNKAPKCMELKAS